MKKSGYSLYTCGNCLLKFVHPLPQSTAEVYGEDYFSGAQGGHGYVDYDNDKEPMVPVFREYLKHVSRLRPERGNLLDVGAATGFFLNLAREAGFTPFGVEISPFAAKKGEEKDIPILAGTLKDVPDNPKFSVITMLDVIEHVENPKQELLRAWELLEPDGLLVINTPDAGSLYARLMGKRWHLIVPPEHLYYFNRKNLSSLLESCGFTTIEVGAIGKKFTPQYIFKTLYVWQKLWIWKLLSDLCARTWGLRRVAISINLHDNLFLIAKKH